MCNISNFRSLGHWSLQNVPRAHSWKEKCFYCLVSYFLRSLIEQNSLKWKAAIPGEQRGSMLDFCQAMILMTLKELLMSQVVVWLQLNVPHPTYPPVDCQIYRWVMTSSSSFRAFIATAYVRKNIFKLGELSELFTLKEGCFYSICMHFDWQIFCAAIFGDCYALYSREPWQICFYHSPER